MSHFSDFDLSDQLLAVLEETDLVTATAVQAGTIPVIRRGGNLVARAGSGSGKTLAYALGVCDRLAGEAGEGRLRALVLVPTPEAAEAVAVSLSPYAEAVDASISTLGGGWRSDEGGSDILVATPAEVVRRVRASGLSLETLSTLVIDGAEEIRALGGWEALDTLLDLLPKDAQRLLFTGRLSPEVDDLAERRIKRALRFPPRAVGAQTPTVGSAGTLHYLVIRADEKVMTAARLLGRRGGDAGPIVFYRRGAEVAAELVEELSRRGFVVGETVGLEVDAVVLEAAEEVVDAAATGAIAVSVDVPADADTLGMRHGSGSEKVVLIEPRERTHLEQIAAELGFRLESSPTPETHVATDIDAFRSEVQRALQQEDLGAQMLVLEPLLAEHSAAEVAAAVAALLRRRRPAAPAPAGPAAAQADRPAPDKPHDRSATAWKHLYISVGRRDDARPGDIVGAIAGEANIPGSHVGKIDLRDNFSIVEVRAEDAERVIQALNGTTVKGRSVRVDFHRTGGDRATRPVRKQVRRPPAGDR